MKRALPYTAAAVLLGVVIMLMPLQIFLMTHGEEGPLVGHAPYLKTLSTSESWRENLADTYGLDDRKTVYQTAEPLVGILGVSIFLASVIYLASKRRRRHPSTRHYPSFGL